MSIFEIVENSYALITWVVGLLIGLRYLGRKLREFRNSVKYLLLVSIALSGPPLKLIFSLSWGQALLIVTVAIVVVALAAALISGEIKFDV